MNHRPKQQIIRLKYVKLKGLYERVFERDERSCVNPYCEGVSHDYEIHHVVYRSHGGDDSEHNLVTLCQACHRQVHDGKLKIAGEYPDLEFILK